MFGLRQHIKLKQARNALRDGRLDEAYAIATEREIREFRDGQKLLDRLVDPLLDRAERHLEEHHLQDALADVERAIVAGGNRPRAANLRERVRDAIGRRRKNEDEARSLIDSARRRLERGSLHAGRELLEKAPADGTGVEGLKRVVEDRERAGVAAVNRAEAYIAEGEIEEALVAAREALVAHGRDGDLPDLLVRLKREAVGRLREALSDGNLGLAGGLVERLRPLFGEHLEVRDLEETLGSMSRAAEFLADGDFEGARVALGRAGRLLPGAPWVERGLAELDAIAAALRELRSGPLGALASRRTAERATLHEAHTVAAPSPAERRGGALPAERRGGALAAERRGGALPAERRGGALPAERRAAHPSRGRLLLWVDGIGTYLVLTSDRISIGRAGSSARPDIALAADLAGHHAEILRVEDDYFIVPAQGTVRVGGAETTRKLLAPGDRIDLGKGCRLQFHVPTAMSTTAILGLHGAQRLEKDVRKVILLDRDLILGPRGNCHIQAPVGRHPVVLSCRAGRIYCRAGAPVAIDGAPAASVTESQGSGAMPVVQEVEVPVGAHVRAGDVSFTITAEQGEER